MILYLTLGKKRPDFCPTLPDSFHPTFARHRQMDDLCRISHTSISLTARKWKKVQDNARLSDAQFVGPIFGRFLPDKSFTSCVLYTIFARLVCDFARLVYDFARFLDDFCQTFLPKILKNYFFFTLFLFFTSYFTLFLILHKSYYFFTYPIFARFCQILSWDSNRGPLSCEFYELRSYPLSHRYLKLYILWMAKRHI